MISYRMSNNELAYGTALSATTWYHLGFYYDQATKKIYINSGEVATETETTNNSDTAENLYIGVMKNGSTKPYDGLLDEFVLAKRYFRPEEIKAAYLKGLNGKEVTSTEIREWNGYAQIIWVD
jgi:hypothetical protein